MEKAPSSLETAIRLVRPYCANAALFRTTPGSDIRSGDELPGILLTDTPLAEEQLGALQDTGVFLIVTDHERSCFDAMKRGLQHFATLGAVAAEERIWIGRAGPVPAYRSDNAPVLISYYTRDTAYEQSAAALQESIEALGDYPFYILGLDDSGIWEVNCSIKAMFILNVLTELDRPVLWVDADAKVFREPVIDDHFDFAVHRFDGWEFASGTVYFNTTEAAIRLARRWVELCQEQPLIWDQILLDRAWCEVSAEHPLVTGWLPETYTFIFDRDRSGLGSGAPVIEHYQASRAVASKRPKPVIPPQLRADRLAARITTGLFTDIRSRLVQTARGPVRAWPGVLLDFERLLQIRQNICQEQGRAFQFIQVGAMDGVRFDPIHEWVRSGAWQGLLIEPLPDIFEELKKNYGAQPGLHFINAAIDREAGERLMYRIPRDHVEQERIPEWALGISSFYNDRNALGGKQVDVATRQLIDELVVSQTVRCTTFEHLLDEYAVSHVDLLQIDTEGHDWAVLQSFPFDRIRPVLIGFEYYNLPDSEFREALAHLERLGYACRMDHKDVTATLLRYPA